MAGKNTIIYYWAIALILAITAIPATPLSALPLSFELRGVSRRHKHPLQDKIPKRLIHEGHLDATEYLQYLVDLHHVVGYIEDLVKSSESPTLQVIAGLGMNRKESMAHDIAFFSGRECETAVAPSPSPVAINYVNHLQEVSVTPHRILAHIWVLYQFVVDTGRKSVSHIAKELHVGTEGLATYRYGGKLKEHQKLLRHRIDNLELTRRQRREISDDEMHKALSFVDRLLEGSP